MKRAITERDVARARELYGRYCFGDFCYGAKRQEHNRPLVDFLASIDSNATVCDIGCGAGYWLEAGLRLGMARERAYGVDLSPANVAAAKAKGFPVLCGDALGLALESDISDFTICNGVIHHTPDPFRAFKELVRITRPGGCIFLGVYNRWNPYFYLVHRAALPIRYLYWNWDKRVLDVIWPVTKVLFQPLAYIVLGTFLDRQTGKTLLMDQVMTPYAHLFSKSTLRRYAQQCGCEIQRFRYTKGYMLLTAVFRVIE